MADIRTSSGTIVSISATLAATHDQAGFEALTFIDINNVGAGGEVGTQRETQTFIRLSDGIKVKVGGAVDNGTQALDMAKDKDDAGQSLLRTHALSGDALSVKCEYSDGEVDYYQGNSTSFRNMIGTANDILKVACNLEVNSTIVTV